jgi:ABC-type uncharacterized transport system auxiliary subunit
MRTITPGKRPLHPAATAIRCCLLLLWAAVFLLSGCAAGGKSPAAIHHYALEYSSPAFKDLALVNDSIRVEPLSIVRNYSTMAMVYRSKPFLYGDDAYHRWKVKPSIMVSDLLLRDMRNAGLFRGVFSNGDMENGGYALGGVIEELYELEDATGSRAVLALNVTLLTTGKPTGNGRTVFQKGYRSVQPMEKGDAESLVRAMSKAMEALSKEIILDTYKAIAGNENHEKRESPVQGLSAK